MIAVTVSGEKFYLTREKSYGCIEFPFLDGVYVLGKRILDWNYILDLLDYDKSKIDFAVPQGWFDAVLLETGEAPEAFWTYERNGCMGEPLYKREILQKLHRRIYNAFLEQIIDGCYFQLKSRPPG